MHSSRLLCALSEFILSIVHNLFSIYNLTYITQFINFIIIAVYNVVHHITLPLPQPPLRPYLSTAPADSSSPIHFCRLNTVDLSLFPPLDSYALSPNLVLTQ